MPDLRVALVGYGLAGRYFHAPLIAATHGLALASVVTASDERRRQLAAEHRATQVLGRTEDLWALSDPPELVVVATPNDSHVSVASTAIDRRIPVVVDKPLALSAAEGDALVDRAERAGVLLSVFQNRRWDTDQLTLRRLIEQGALGSVTRYESRFERWRPEPDPGKWREALSPERGGGVLVDLGSHLVDQALVLFGEPTHVYAEIATRRGLPSDDDAFVALHHASGTISHLWASAVTPAPGPRLRVQGTSGAFVVSGLDPQEAALRDGVSPADSSAWGIPPEFEHGRLFAGERSIPIPPEPGNWPRFYELMRDAIRDGGAPPVDPRDAVITMRVLEAALESSRERSVIAL